MSGSGCRSPVAFGRRFWHRSARCRRGLHRRHGCGCSSVVEHDLAKVGVEGSNPFARSKPPLLPSPAGHAPVRSRIWVRCCEGAGNARSPDALFLIAPSRQALLDSIVRDLAARFRVRGLLLDCPLQAEGTGNAGRWPHPWPACNKKCRRQVPQVQPRHPGIPRANGFNGCFAFSPVRRAFWPPCAHDAFASARISASGYQDHAT